MDDSNFEKTAPISSAVKINVLNYAVCMNNSYRNGIHHSKMNTMCVSVVEKF